MWNFAYIKFLIGLFGIIFMKTTRLIKLLGRKRKLELTIKEYIESHAQNYLELDLEEDVAIHQHLTRGRNGSPPNYVAKKKAEDEAARKYLRSICTDKHLFKHPARNYKRYLEAYRDRKKELLENNYKK